MEATVTADAGAEVEVEVGGVLLLAPLLILLVVAMDIGVAVAGGLASSVSGSVLMLLVSVPAYASLSMWGQLSSPRPAQKPVRNSRVMPSPACRFV